MRRCWISIIILWLPGQAVPLQAQEKDKDAILYNKLLGRGINLGNALEAPQEGAWGMKLEAEFFQKIKEAGFNSLRLPIRWSAHAGTGAPFTIDPVFFQRVDWAIEQALSRGLAAAINFHHFEEIFNAPEQNEERFLALWQQVAQRYRRQPDRLFFEILNEPHNQLTPERWQKLFPKVLQVIRRDNPDRLVIIGPGQWNNLNQLDKLVLPVEDRRLIVTFHYYSPFPFTHQNAGWVKGSSKWKGTTWKGTAEQRAALGKDFERAAAWGQKHRRPLYLGEFGAYAAADMESRALWTRAVAREAEKHSMSWAYWEFGAGFGAYDRQAHSWRTPLVNALLDR